MSPRFSRSIFSTLQNQQPLPQPNPLHDNIQNIQNQQPHQSIFANQLNQNPQYLQNQPNENAQNVQSVQHPQSAFASSNRISDEFHYNLLQNQFESSSSTQNRSTSSKPTPIASSIRTRKSASDPQVTPIRTRMSLVQNFVTAETPGTKLTCRRCGATANKSCSQLLCLSCCREDPIACKVHARQKIAWNQNWKFFWKMLCVFFVSFSEFVCSCVFQILETKNGKFVRNGWHVAF